MMRINSFLYHVTLSRCHGDPFSTGESSNHIGVVIKTFRPLLAPAIGITAPVVLGTGGRPRRWGYLRAKRRPRAGFNDLNGRRAAHLNVIVMRIRGELEDVRGRWGPLVIYGEQRGVGSRWTGKRGWPPCSVSASVVCGGVDKAFVIGKCQERVSAIYRFLHLFLLDIVFPGVGSREQSDFGLLIATTVTVVVTFYRSGWNTKKR